MRRFINVQYCHPNLEFRQDGVFAMADIGEGEVALRETPMLKLRIKKSSRISSGISSQAFDESWNSLSESEQQAFSELPLNTGFDHEIKDPCIARWCSNCLACSSELEQYAVALLGSRFQQSCSPNTLYRLVEPIPNSFYFEYRTTCRVRRGTQLQVTYDILGILCTAQKRCSRLRKRKGIDCRCVSCHPGAVGSDQRRAVAKPIVEAQQRRGTIPEILAALEALHQEGVYHFDAPLYRDAYEQCHRNGDHNNALLFRDHCLRIAWREGVVAPDPLT